MDVHLLRICQQGGDLNFQGVVITDVTTVRRATQLLKSLDHAMLACHTPLRTTAVPLCVTMVLEYGFSGY